MVWNAGDADAVHAVMRSQGRRVKCCRKVAAGCADRELMETASCSLSSLMDAERQNVKREKRGKK